MKILPVAAELFHAERRKNMTNLIVAFRNFANEPKNNICTFDTPKMASSLSFLLPFLENF